MAETHKHFVPAAGYDWLLPLYDPLLKLLGADSVRRELVDQAAIGPGHRILDIGCGTGSLVVMVKRLHPDAEVIGLDPDPKALARGERKAKREPVPVRLERGYSDDLPYPDDSFDHLFSSFMFHHLDTPTQQKTLREARRVLKPRGSLHLLDFGGSHGRFYGWLARLLHAGDRLEDNFGGRIPALMNDAGFSDVAESGHRATWFGGVSRYRALAPAPPGDRDEAIR